MSSRSGTVRVLVADDHPLFRDGVSRQISETEGLVVVAAVDDGHLALQASREYLPDVALLDLDMPRLNGVEVLREIKRENLNVKVLILTGSVEDEWIIAALREGASGYIVKTLGWKEVADAVMRVAKGEIVVDPRLLSVVVGGLNRDEPTPALLTEREVTILSLLREKTAVQVGRELHLSEGTVRKDLTRIYGKLGVHGKTQAITEAISKGLI